MTATSAPPAFQPVTTAAPTKVRDRKGGRSLLWGLIALALVVFLGVVWFVNQAGGDEEYIGLAREVPYGIQVTADDIVIVKIVNDTKLSPVPAAHKDKVIGQYATMTLAKGSLLTSEQLSSQAIPGATSMIVSIPQKADQAPAHPLKPGTPVQLIRTGQDSSSNAETSSPMGPVEGKVLAVRELEYGGGAVVDVVVSSAQGPSVAIAASTGKIALVVTAGR